MAEDQDNQDEEKLEFTPEGEALGYIGMDQAQVRAMQVATETPGDYGSAYTGIRMAFEVVNAQESEDHYVITLSLRPQGDFSGRPGQEQFFIEKEGAVAHRQVLALPRSRGRFPVIPAVVGLAVVVAAIGAVVGTGAIGGSGPAPTPTPLPTNTLAPPPAPTEAPAVFSPSEATPASTLTATPRPTPAPTPVATFTPTPVPTATPRPTAIPTPVSMASPRPTATPTPVPTATPRPTTTLTPVPTATTRPTATPTPLPTATPTPASTPTPTPTPVPPSAGRIAFVSSQDGSKEIYVMNPDGTDQWQLTSDNCFNLRGIAWSPNGAHIAFGCDRRISVINADGTGLRLLSSSWFNTNQRMDRDPAWSPDGRRIAFVSRRDGNDDIYVVNTDGSDERRLTTNRSGDTYPAWSPDGRRIAFSSLRNHLSSFAYDNTDIYVMSANGASQQRLAGIVSLSSETSPAWSPDGTRIAFVSGGSGQDDVADVYVMKADGSNLTRLTKNYSQGEWEQHLAWSPDGNRIAFVSGRGQDEIYVMNADGSDQTRLTFGGGWSPAWSPVGPTSIVTAIRDLNDSGQSGTATLTEIGNQTRVTLNLSSGRLDSELVHIHLGRCGNTDGGVEYPLTSFVGGSGLSTTVVDASLGVLRFGDHAIIVHKSGEPWIYTACANIAR